jgi:hypothetical protein
MEGACDLNIGYMLTITNGFFRRGVWFKPPKPPSSSSKEKSLDFETSSLVGVVT